jgi:hypothetical protein
MACISISKWTRKFNRPRYYVCDGREPVGIIFERRGIFTAIDTDGNLVIASTGLQIAANALTTGESS